MVSKASDDLPDPDSPVMTVSALRGISTSMFFRLCTRALVRKGLPFRKAHAVVGQCVAYAIKEHKFLLDMTLDEYKQFCELFEPDLMEALDPEHCVNARVSYGGPSYVENDKQLEKGEAILKEQEETLRELREKI